MNEFGVSHRRSGGGRRVVGIGALSMRRFQMSDAPSISAWVRSPEELRLLAPSTSLPLTPAKVVGWRKPGGYAVVLVQGRLSQAVAYGEINPMSQDVSHFWIGHVLVNPRYRGQGVGARFVSAMVSEALTSLGGERISLVVVPANEAAIRCYESVGFVRAGEELHRLGRSGRKVRLARYEIHRDSPGRWRALANSVLSSLQPALVASA